MFLKNQHVILLGSAGTGTAFAAACSLRRIWSQSVVVIAMDVNPFHLVTSSLLADHFEQVPFSAAPDFSEKLIHLIERYEVDTYMPLIPDEILLATQLQEEGRIASSVRVMVPPLQTSALCADKWMLSQALTGFGIPSPKTAQAIEPFEAEEFFLKPKNGVGSRGAGPLKMEELSYRVGKFAEKWIVQEICTPPEITVDAFYDPREKTIRVICRHRIETKEGVSTKARLFEDKELTEIAIALAENLDLSGSFCFQVMRNLKGWVVTDVNPRPGAATAMCALTGNDFFAASFAYYWGEDTKRFFRPLLGEQFVTRQYSEFLMGSNL